MADDNTPPAPMHWFGNDWGAPCCTAERHVKGPTAEQRCAYCAAPFAANAQGVSLLGYQTKPEPSWVLEYWHLECFLQALGLDFNAPTLRTLIAKEPPP